MKRLIIKFSLALLLCQSTEAKIAPHFQGDLLGGGRASLTELLEKAQTQKHALLVCFWATWCTPCMQELKAVADKMMLDKSIPLDVLTVNVDTSETSTDVKPTLKLYKFDLPVVLDPKHEIFSKYQDSKTLPFSVLISPKGDIAETFSGYNEDMFSKIKQVAGGTKETNAQN